MAWSMQAIIRSGPSHWARFSETAHPETLQRLESPDPYLHIPTTSEMRFLSCE